MEKEKFEKRAPDYANSQQGLAVWVNESQDGKKYLSIQLLGGQIKLVAFKNEPKPIKKASEL